MQVAGRPAARPLAARPKRPVHNTENSRASKKLQTGNMLAHFFQLERTYHENTPLPGLQTVKLRCPSCAIRTKEQEKDTTLSYNSAGRQP